MGLRTAVHSCCEDKTLGIRVRFRFLHTAVVKGSNGGYFPGQSGILSIPRVLGARFFATT